MKFITKYKLFLSELGLLYAAFIWGSGSTFIIVKNSLGSINPIILVGYRFLLAAIIMLPFLLIRQKNILKHISKGLILGILLWLLYAPQTLGLKFTSATNSVLITGLFIVFVPLFALMFYKRLPTINQIFAVLIALFGFWLLTGGLQNINLGDGLTLITAAAYALHILFADKYVKNKIDPYVLSFQQFLTVGVLSLLTGLFFKLPFSYGNIQILWIIIFLTIFPGLLAFVIQLLAQKNLHPVKVALIFAMEPVFGVLAAWIFGGEQIGLLKASGGLFIVLGIIISELKSV